MKALAVSLVALAILDAVLGSTRVRRTAGVVVVAVVPATVCAFVGALLVGYSTPTSAVLAATVAFEAPLWAAARRSVSPRPVLGALAVALVARFATVGLWRRGFGPSVFDRWVETLPSYPTWAADSDRVAYVLAAMIFLATAGNTLVRLLLNAVGGLSPGSPKTPGGGRVIGSIERSLIFALALAGQPTAATLMVSAKGILRFAEVRAADGADVDTITEYVLVGSLASYALALAFVPLALP